MINEILDQLFGIKKSKKRKSRKTRQAKRAQRNKFRGTFWHSEEEFKIMKEVGEAYGRMGNQD